MSCRLITKSLTLKRCCRLVVALILRYFAEFVYAVVVIKVHVRYLMSFLFYCRQLLAVGV